MHKRLTLLLTIKDGAFQKTRSFNPEHIYSTSHIDFDSFDEVIFTCLDTENLDRFIDFVRFHAPLINVPLVLSGGVTSIDEARILFDLGADRIIINRGLWSDTEKLRVISLQYGKQAIIASLDICCLHESCYLYTWHSKTTTRLPSIEELAALQEFVGEILIQDCNRDGRVIGPHLPTLKKLFELMPLKLPIHIGSCGIVGWRHYSDLLQLPKVGAVAVTNVHHMSSEAAGSLRRQVMISGTDLRPS
jgi:cyclase